MCTSSCILPIDFTKIRVLFLQRRQTIGNEAMHIEKGLICLFELKHIVVVWYMYRYTVLLVLDLVRTAVLVLVGVIEVYMYQ